MPLLPCSNFQSSAMFEGSESVEVEGCSADSTMASSISACKKVRPDLDHICFMLGWRCSSLSMCVQLSVCSDHFTFFSPSVHERVHLSVISVSSSQAVCVLPAMEEIFISSSGVLVTPRGCVIRGTAMPSGQPSRFIISQHQRDRRGNSTDQWAEVEAILNFLSKCV